MFKDVPEIMINPCIFFPPKVTDLGALVVVESNGVHAIFTKEEWEEMQQQEREARP